MKTKFIIKKLKSIKYYMNIFLIKLKYNHISYFTLSLVYYTKELIY